MSAPDKAREHVAWLACGVVAIAWGAAVVGYMGTDHLFDRVPVPGDPFAVYRPMLVTGMLMTAVCLLLWAVYLAGSWQMRRQARKERRLRMAVEEAYRGTLHALTAALDMRDDETYGHSCRVMGYSLAMGRRLGLSQNQMQTLAWGALLHDLGKIGIRDGILLKPGPLSREERAEMNQHVIIGQQLVQNVPFLARTHAMIRHHHERYDGNGYPDRLAGEEIPLLARIFTVADSFDAMTSSRPYRREPFSLSQALEEVRKGTGTQFCPSVAAAFLQIPLAELEQIRTDSFLPLRDHGALVHMEMPEEDGTPYYLRDSLTGALNRTAWEAKLALMAKQGGVQLGTVLFFDMDRLKPVNDRHGHQAGDRVLADLGARLIQLGPELYRVGGDEFILWLPPGQWTPGKREKVQETLDRFAEYWSQTIPGISVSWGAGSADPDTADLPALVRAADSAMYRHKAGR